MKSVALKKSLAQALQSPAPAAVHPSHAGLQSVQGKIFTMVSYFLRLTLMKFFSSFPDEQSQQKVRQLCRITCAVINTSNEVKSPLLWEFWMYNFSLRILERVLGWKHCKYKEWVSFYLIP